jgi:curved DNA-binding protein CbpA
MNQMSVAPGVAAKPLEEDYYEILRISPRADEDTVERVYRTLAERFHPDNESSGDPETFLRVTEAYETLSNPDRRWQYDDMRERSQTVARFRLRARDFFDGIRGEQNRRLAVLCLLYRRRISSHDSPGRSLLDLEQLTCCTREELNSVLWYLSEKQWVKCGEMTEYIITAQGFDFVETELKERAEFRAFATLRYYTPQPEPEGAQTQLPPAA